jgi:hypothetical protein
MQIIQEDRFDLFKKYLPQYCGNPIGNRRLVNISCLSKFLSLLILLGFSFIAVRAQGNAVRGQVVDQRGSAIGAARVTLSDGAKEPKAATTDGEGRFVFQGIAAGRYRLAVAAIGFTVYSDEVMVGMSSADPLRISLNVESLKNQVEVTAGRGTLSLDAGANASALVLRGDALKRLPHNQEQLMRVLERMSGSFARSLDISVNGLAGASLPPAATIKEIRINSDPFAASYHELGSARVEVETKGGDEQIQASIYFNYRNSALDARNAFSVVKPPLEYRDLGAWWSSKLFGPRSFIFGLVERQRHDDNIPVTAYLPEGPFNANVPTPSKTLLANLRADFVPSDRHTFSVLFNLNQGRQRGSEITSLDLPERSFDARPVEQSLQASWRAIFSPRLVNEAQIRFVRERAANTTENPSAAVEVGGAFNGGGPQCCPERHAGERLSLADNLSFSAGRHFLKTGVIIAGAHLSQLSERDFGGTFYYASLSFYQLRRPLLYTVSTGEPNLGFSLWQFAGYVQDDIRVKSNFTLSPGLRYESQTHLADRNNFAPRLGFAWSPFKGQNTVIRGGAGVFYQQLEEGRLAEALRYDGVRQRQVIVNRPRLPDPLGGRPIDSFPASINRLADGLRTPYQMHAAIGVEQRLPHDAVLTVTYNYVRGLHLFRSRDANAPQPGTFTRPNPEFGRIAELESSSTATYHGLSIGFSQSIGERVSLFGNYSLSRAIDDADGPTAFPADGYNLIGERGFAARDERHQAFAGALLVLPYRLEVSPMIYFNTGRPYNITTGFDDNGDSVPNDRPTGLRRNSGRGPNFASVDLRLARSFRFGRGAGQTDVAPFGIEIAAEASNLFNRVNLEDFNGIQTSPFFGRANAAHPARQIALQLNLYFH